MALLTRRRFLQGAGGLALSSFGLGSYAFALEPGYMLDITSYQVLPRRWTPGLTLRIGVIADLHACEPWMGPARIRRIAETVNAMKADMIVLLGDFNGGQRIASRPVYPDQWAEALSILRAPLGVYAILGNHDFWHGPLPGMPSGDGEPIRAGLRKAGIRLLENDALRLTKDGKPFWIAGLADQIAHWKSHAISQPLDDLPGTLRQVSDDAPLLLLAHEPYIYRHLTDRVSLTLCGHTHGGQVKLPVLGPVAAAYRFGPDLVYGLVGDENRQMIISAGLGTSGLPVRFMRPPELVHVTIGAPPPIA